MKIKSFQTERFFARHEFSAPHLLCASDCESLTVDELLRLAGAPADALGTLRLGYTESQGSPQLRRQIAGMYAHLGADQIVGLGAPEEGIFCAMHALLERDDEVVVLAPCYDSLLNVVEYLGCRIARWWLTEAPEPPDGPGGWRLDFRALARLVTLRTKLVIVNFPHNPTGYLPTAEEWEALIRMVRRAGAWLFSDEMYRGLEYEPEARLVPACDLYEKAITLCGLSKTYGLPGLRTGWLALQDAALRDRILGWKDYTSICASAPSEALALVALQAGEALADRSRAIVLENLALADRFFARYRDQFRWNRPHAGSVALVGLRAEPGARVERSPGAERISATAFCQRLLEEQGVLLLPATGLGAGDGHVRFGLGRRSFPLALDQLDQYLTRQQALPGM
jgi:aspartate/methionine/tyrosine aminotransferase